MSGKLFGVTGWKNSGKTHLVSHLVTEFSDRAIKVSTIKHAHHSFDIDHPNTDTWKHRQAGAGEVAIVSNNRWALMHELKDEAEPSLSQISKKLAPCDLILVEGYKQEPHLKIETVRTKTQIKKQAPLWKTDKSIIAIVSDETIDGASLPVFKSNEIQKLADFILKQLESVK